MPRKFKRTVESYIPDYNRDDSDIELCEAFHNLGTISATGNYFLMTTKSDIRVIELKLVVDTTVAIDTTDYWQAQLANLTNNVNLLSTADNMNYDSTLTGDTVYTITPDQNVNVREGSVLELQLTKNASADNLSGLYVHLKYVVTGSLATTTSTSSSTTTTSSSTTSTSSSTTSTSSSSSSSTSTSITTSTTTTSSSTTSTSSSTTSTSSSTTSTSSSTTTT